MKLIISSSELLRGVMAVSKAIPAKSPLPILENFLFDLKGKTLEITASDTELTLKTKIEVEETAEEGRILIVHDHNEKYSIDTNDYGIDARMLVDPAKKLITIYIGGEAYCIPYMQNDPG